jgi:hypothetical protein
LVASGQIVLVAAAVVITLYLVNRQLQPDPGNSTSIEEQWDDAISRLGIQPVYPPQEDIAVGDVFVTVAADTLGSYGNNQGGASSRSFLGKSVKLGHANVAQMLEDVYQAMPLFPEIQPAVAASALPNGSAPATLFGTHAERVELPRAAFPGLTITDDGSAATAISGGRGWFNFGASRAASQKLVLGVVETYGLDPVTGEEALKKFCEAGKLCTDPVARKYLRSLVKDRATDEHFDPKTQTFLPDLTIRIIMIYRIYLAREILEQWSSLVSEGGGIRAAISSAAETLKPSDQSNPSDQTKNGGDATNSLEKRLEEVERQLNDAHQGGAIVYRSSAGTDILLDQKFPRALAVGYRSVDYDPPTSDSR